jgi:hypothetical protein
MMRTNSDKSVRVFPVETQFQKLARREGGVPRDKAIEQANATVEEVKPDFDEWLGTELDGLNGIIKKAQAGEAETDWAEQANRHSRQLRDVGTTMGFTLLTFIAGSLCEILDEITAGAEYKMETVTCHVDALFLARQKRYRNMRPEQVPELTRGLRRIADNIGSSAN